MIVNGRADYSGSTKKQKQPCHMWSDVLAAVEITQLGSLLGPETIATPVDGLEGICAIPAT